MNVAVGVAVCVGVLVAVLVAIGVGVKVGVSVAVAVNVGFSVGVEVASPGIVCGVQLLNDTLKMSGVSGDSNNPLSSGATRLIVYVSPGCR